MFKFVDCKDSFEIFSGYTLILPAVSVGNVGQLACDLLISTLELKKVGYFSPDCFLPLAGNNPFSNSTCDQSALCINCEVYIDSKHKLSIIQIRSPLIESKRKNFQDNLLKWMKECKFKELVILSSCHSYERTDQQILGTPFRYVASAEEQIAKFKQLQWSVLEERMTGHAGEQLFLPGGGFAKSLFEACSSSEVPSVILFVFCSEGDNIPEAVILASHFNQWKHCMCLHPHETFLNPPFPLLKIEVNQTTKNFYCTESFREVDPAPFLDPFVWKSSPERVILILLAPSRVSMLCHVFSNRELSVARVHSLAFLNHLLIEDRQ